MLEPTDGSSKWKSYETMYECRPCKLTAICGSCARICHKNHCALQRFGFFAMQQLQWSTERAAFDVLADEYDDCIGMDKIKQLLNALHGTEKEPVVSEEDTDRNYRERLGRAHRYGVPEVVLIHPFAPGGCYVQHLLAEEEGYRTRATSTSPDAPVEVPTLGIRLAGGDRLVAEDEYGPWQDTASLAEHVRRQTEEARRQGERADRLAEALRAAGIDPDSI